MPGVVALAPDARRSRPPSAPDLFGGVPEPRPRPAVAMARITRAARPSSIYEAPTTMHGIEPRPGIGQPPLRMSILAPALGPLELVGRERRFHRRGVLRRHLARLQGLTSRAPVVAARPSRPSRRHRGIREFQRSPVPQRRHGRVERLLDLLRTRTALGRLRCHEPRVRLVPARQRTFERNQLVRFEVVQRPSCLQTRQLPRDSAAAGSVASQLWSSMLHMPWK